MSGCKHRYLIIEITTYTTGLTLDLCWVTLLGATKHPITNFIEMLWQKMSGCKQIPYHRNNNIYNRAYSRPLLGATIMHNLMLWVSKEYFNSKWLKMFRECKQAKIPLFHKKCPK